MVVIVVVVVGVWAEAIVIVGAYVLVSCKAQVHGSQEHEGKILSMLKHGHLRPVFD